MSREPEIEIETLLDEQALRRADFAGGDPVILGDGQAWSLPKPSLILVPEVMGGHVRFADKVRHGHGPAYDALVDTFVEAEEGLDQMNALLGLAVDLLTRNYLLGPEHLAELLPRRLGDDANTEMWREVRDVALGLAPKRTPVG